MSDLELDDPMSFVREVMKTLFKKNQLTDEMITEILKISPETLTKLSEISTDKKAKLLERLSQVKDKKLKRTVNKITYLYVDREDCENPEELKEIEKQIDSFSTKLLELIDEICKGDIVLEQVISAFVGKLVNDAYQKYDNDPTAIQKLKQFIASKWGITLLSSGALLGVAGMVMADKAVTVNAGMAGLKSTGVAMTKTGLLTCHNPVGFLLLLVGALTAMYGGYQFCQEEKHKRKQRIAQSICNFI